MDFADRVRELAAQLSRQLAHISTEEATKNALVMPMIAALGYNVFDPTEVTPELNADVGVKKGEKVDYAILQDGKPTILFECKWHGADLNKEHASQLYRYFSVTEARFGVLTNGIQYRFYSDLDAQNKMDAKPFFVFDMLSFRDYDLEELKKFSRSSYDLNNILATASELKYTKAIQSILSRELQSPSDEFVRFFAGQVYEGRMTQAIREQFSITTARAFRHFISDRVNERLQTALLAGSDAGPLASEPTPTVSNLETAADPIDRVVTSNDEMEAFYTIRAILHGEVNSGRVAMRDVQTYCGVLLDNNNRKPICRLYFNTPRKAIGLFDNADRKERRILIDSLEDIHEHAEQLKATVQRYESRGERSTAEETQAPIDE